MAKKKAEAPMMVIQSKMKEYLSSLGLRSSGDVADGLNEKVTDVLSAAAERCKSNGRSTVRASDL
jgi:histone H3/H4